MRCSSLSLNLSLGLLGKLLLAMLFYAVQPTGTWAAEWSVLPSIGVKGVYNDNLLMTPLPHDETYGYWISPAAEFAGKTERLEVKGRVASDFVTYYGGKETQFTNIFLPLTMRYKTETDLLEFNGGYTRDNTLQGELDTTGLILRFTQRNQITTSPAWTRSLTEKLSIQTSLQFSDTTYDRGPGVSLVDYQTFGGSGGVLYNLTEQDQVQLNGTYVRFRTLNSPSAFRADIPGISLSLSHAFTESLTGSISGGPRFLSTTSQVSGSSITSRDTVWIFGGSIQQRLESTTLQLSAARNVAPSGLGLLITSDRLSTIVTHDLNEAVTASFDASVFQVSGAGSSSLSIGFPDQRYASATPKISWKFAEWWRAELSYTYRWGRGSDTTPDVTSNGTMFTITYYPPKLALSN